MFIGSNIEYLMKENGLNQAKLAQLLGKKNYSIIGKYISNDRKPSFEVLVMLREIFNVSIDDLVFKDLSK